MSAAATLASTQAPSDSTSDTSSDVGVEAERPDEWSARWIPFLALPDDA